MQDCLGRGSARSAPSGHFADQVGHDAAHDGRGEGRVLLAGAEQLKVSVWLASGLMPGPAVSVADPATKYPSGECRLFPVSQGRYKSSLSPPLRRIDAIFAIERDTNGLSAAQRHTVRQVKVAPLVAALEQWMRGERATLSRHADVAKAMDYIYMLKRWAAFTRFLDDGRICLTNNAAERALRSIALGRKSWLFAGSDRGGERAAAVLPWNWIKLREAAAA